MTDGFSVRVYKDSLYNLLNDFEKLGWTVESINFSDEDDVFIISVTEHKKDAETADSLTVQVSIDGLQNFLPCLQKINAKTIAIKPAQFHGVNFLLIKFILA